MKKPRIVILAGGEGKRFKPLTTCKTLFPFLGKPLLQHTLEMVEKAGCTDVLISSNEKNDQWIQSYNSSLKIRTKKQPEPLGMADAVLNLKDEIGSEPCLILNAGDMVEPAVLSRIMEQIEKNNPYGLIVGKKTDTHVPAGYLQLDENRVIGIVEKPAPGEEPSNMINLVFHYYSRPDEFIAELEQISTKGDDIYEQALTTILHNHTVELFSYDGYWQKLKYPHFVLDMMDLFLSTIKEQKIDEKATIADNVVINGNVWVDKGATIHPGAVVQGPAYIGKNAVVGNNSLVRHSIIEEKAVVGFSSEVARSYIGPESMLHHNFIGDSILERNVNPSWGTTTGNLRLDGKPIAVKMPDGARIQTERTKLGAILADGVFCGINCSLMPGIAMGKDARVKPGTVVYEAIG